MNSPNSGHHARQPVASPEQHTNTRRPRPRGHARGARRQRQLSGTAAAGITSVLAGPTRPARILGSFPSAVYLQLTDTAYGPVVALLTADAVRLPNAIVLEHETANRPFAGLHSTDNAGIGNQHMQIGPLRIDVARVWTPRRPNSPTPDLPAKLAMLQRYLSEHAPAVPLQHTLPPSTSAARHLADATATENLNMATTTASRMLGRGPGLTPSGDDYLAGFLTTLALQAEPTRADFTARLGHHIATTARTATTALSATLLEHAAHGEAPPEVSDVLDALGRHEHALEKTTSRLLTVGHSSGYQLARGIGVAAHVLANDPDPRIRPASKSDSPP